MDQDPLMTRVRAAKPSAPERRDHRAGYAAIVAEPGDARFRATSGRRSLSLPRPRLLAGSTVGMAGVAAGLVLALSGGTAAPAFAVTQQSDGTVLVTINDQESVPQADAKLMSDGDNEEVAINFQMGAATTSGPVACTVGSGVTGPPVKVLLGSDGTEVISGNNTGAGTWHVAGCETGTPGSNTDIGPNRTAVPLTTAPVNGAVGTETVPIKTNMQMVPMTGTVPPLTATVVGGSGNTGNTGNTGN